jgi:hypothetical protein
MLVTGGTVAAAALAVVGFAGPASAATTDTSSDTLPNRSEMSPKRSVLVDVLLELYSLDVSVVAADAGPAKPTTARAAAATVPPVTSMVFFVMLFIAELLHVSARISPNQ